MPDLPEFPEEARIAAQEKRLIVFLGAGLSCAAGMKDWNSLKESLITRCRPNGGDQDGIRAQWRNMKFYECFMAMKNADKTNYEQGFKEAFEIGHDVNVKAYQKWIEIIKGWGSLSIVTTNVDSLLLDNSEYQQKDFRKKSECSAQEIRSNKIFFIHGLGMESIFDLLDRDELYDNSTFKGFLYTLFGAYCIFFIGFSLSDDELLKFAKLGRFLTEKEGNQLFHIALLPEEENIRSEELKTYGIKPYFYPKENNDKYGNFIPTLEKWNLKKFDLEAKDLSEAGKFSKIMSFIEKTKQIDQLLITFSNENAKKILSYLNQDQDLIPYFLKKAEAIEWFDILRNEGYFSSEKNPSSIPSKENTSLFTIPYWQSLTYLEKVSKEAAKPNNKKYAKALMEILSEVTMPENDPSKRVDNDRTWYIFCKIMTSLPTDVIKLEDIDLIGYWLDSKFDNGLVGHEIGRNLLPKLLKSGSDDDFRKAVCIVEIVTRSKGEGKTLMDADELEELFKKNASDLGTRCGKEVIPILQSRLESEQVISEKDDNYSYIWRSAVEDHAQNTNRHEPRHALISGLRDVLTAYVQREDASVLLKKLWQSPRLTVGRIALFALNKCFDRHQDLCQKLIIDNIPDIFLESNYHHELYGLIVGHFPKFSKKNQDALIKALDDLQRKWPDNVPQNEQTELNMYTRKRWFYAIKQSGYLLSKELETKYDLDKYQPEHPDLLSYHGPGTWGTEQLFSVGDLMAKGNVKSIVDFLKDFKDKNRFNEIGYEEAGQVLKQAVKTNPQVFETDIDEFLRSIPDYQYYLLRAFEEIWNDKKPVNWERILGFVWKLINQDDFWKKENPEPKQCVSIRIGKDSIPSAIADLIEKGVKNDEWVMPDDCLPDVHKILTQLLEKVESSAKGRDSDALNEAINSPKGHVIQTFINYALCQCRVYEKKCQNKGIKEREDFWKTLEPLFNRELEKTKNANFEFSALAGSYLPNLYYLSKEWVEANINRIFPVESEYEKNWRCAVSGYSYVNTVYTVIYCLLKDNGHLKRVLDASFDSSNIRERIIENIAISYLRGEEDLRGENSLMAYILEKWQAPDISSVIDLFWSHREVDFKNGEDQRILAFWEYCYNRIKGKENSHQNILSDLNLLAVFLKQIDAKPKEWLVQSAPYVEHRHHAYFFLESLDRLADTNPKEVGEVYMAMLNGNALPLYEESNIQSIVEKLYKAKETALASQICDRYTRAGPEFLKDLYEKYNR